MQHDELLKLYKYRSLAGEHGRQTAEDIVLHHRLYWQSPLSFNDPFDCDPYVIFGTNAAERTAWIKRANANNILQTNRYQRRSKKRELEALPPAQHEANMRAAWREWMGETGVTCFSAVGDHQLMWGHYADSHKGICFVFEEALGQHKPWLAFEVHYSATRPEVNLTQLRDKTVMRDSLLNKSAVWSYEKELRMVEWRVPPGYREFPVNSLLGIILGARISEDDRAFMLALAARRPYIQISQAQVDEKSFRLNIVPI